MTQDQEHKDRERLTRDLELAELRAQNLDLGSRIVDLESETISQRQRIMELEAKIALDQRVKMREQIAKARERVDSELAAAKTAAAQGFRLEGLEAEGLTSAKLRGG